MRPPSRPFTSDASTSRALAPSSYFDPQFFEREREQIFARSWKYAAHKSEMRKPGAYVTIEVAGESVALVRGVDDAVRAFYNVCQHRAHRLLEGDGCVERIRCPYHAWTYRLDGGLAQAPHAGDQIDRSCFGLESIRVEEVCGFYFVNLDPSAAPLSDTAGGLAEEIRRYVPKLAELEKVSEWCEVRDANWKLVIENDLECYHCPPAHRFLSRRLNLKNYRSIDHGAYVTHIIPQESERGVRHEQDAFLYWFLWPDTEARVMPGPTNLAWYTTEPLSSGRTRLRYHHFLAAGQAEAAASAARHDPDEDPTVEEDVKIVETVQLGLQSRGYRGGAFVVNRDSSNTEHSVHHFQTLVAGAMAMPCADDEVEIELRIEGQAESRSLRGTMTSDNDVLVRTPAPLASGTLAQLWLGVSRKLYTARVERVLSAKNPLGDNGHGMVLSLQQADADDCPAGDGEGGR